MENRNNKVWTDEEVDYLTENYGTISIPTMAKNLNRSVRAVIRKKDRLQLGHFLDNGDYITLGTLLLQLGQSQKYRNKEALLKAGLPVFRKKVINNSFLCINIEDFWKWFETHSELIEINKLEENSLGVEPKWVKEKRRSDMSKPKKKNWELKDIQRLKIYTDKGMSTQDIAVELNRSYASVDRKCRDLGLKIKNKKQTIRPKWSEEKTNQLKKYVIMRKSYPEISQLLNMTEKAVRAKVYHLCGSESLDKFRGLN